MFLPFSPHAPDSHETIGLKDLLGDILTHPFASFGHITDVITKNIVDDRYRIIGLLIIFPIVQWVVLKGVDAWVNTHFSDPEYVIRLPRNSSQSQKELFRIRRKKRRAAVASLLKSCIRVILGIIIGVMLLAQCGVIIDSNTVKWVSGALALALGLGLQTFFKDFLTGAQAVSEGQYGLGDYLDLGLGITGEVQHIGVRTVRLGGPDGTVYYISHSMMTKFGNRTQSESHLLMDVTLTWGQEREEVVGQAELEHVEYKLAASIKTVRNQLNAAHEIVSALPSENSDISLAEVASVLPSITEDLSDTTLTNLNIVAQGDAKSEAEAQKQVERVLSTVDTVPLLKEINTIGVVKSTMNSLTIRISVDLPAAAAREQALAAIRRQTFIDFSEEGLTISFEEINAGVVL